VHRAIPLVRAHLITSQQTSRRLIMSGRHDDIDWHNATLLRGRCYMVCGGVAGAGQGAVSSTAPTDKVADDPLARFHEHQKTAARISTVEEARMLIDVNR
jgi:hypothetical protein